MNASRAQRRAAVALACAVGATMLTGCGPVDAGSAAAEDIEQEFSDVDGVAAVAASGSNDLPFVGSVEATVTTEPGLPDARVDALAEELADYMDASSGITWSIAVVADAITVGIPSDDAQRALQLEVARELADLPGAEAVRVAIDYEDPVVLVEVDAPEALADAYSAARAAVDRLGIDQYDTNAGAVSGEGAFTIDDEARNGEDTAIGTPLRIFEAALARFTLTAASVTPEKLELRVASEADVPAMEAVIAAMPVPDGLEIELQGGKSTIEADASPAADAVATALRDIEEVVEVTATGNVVTIEVAALDDAPAALDAISGSPDFLALDGFGAHDPEMSFQVFDRPEGFAASLALAETASALPSIHSVEATRFVDEATPSLRLRFDSAGRDLISALASTMKPALVAGGWDVWLNADGFVESFRAEDRIVLEERAGGDRDAAEQEFADELVRTWDAAASS